MKHWRTALILLLVALILTTSGCSRNKADEDQTATGVIAPLSHSALIDSDGLFKVVGEVQNTGSKSLTQAAVKVTFYGASGVVLDEETSPLTARILKPDQKWPFSVAASPGLPVADVDHYVVEIDDSSVEDTDEQPYGDLVIISENSTASGGTYTVQGQVRNNGSQVAKLVRVVATFYDATGTVVADREQFVLGATATQLTPGEVASFSITVGETLGTYIAPRGAADESQDTVLESLATQQVSGQPAGGEPADTAPGGDIASYETQADSSTTSSPTSGSGTCCSRSIGALDPKMPPGQLSPMGGWLSDAMDGPYVADPANRHCPRDLWILDMDWREQLHLIVNDMGYAAGAPYDPATEAAFANFNDLDYLIMGQLTLDQQTDYVARVCEPPPWEGHCVGGDIIGRWTFKMELVDHHRGQVVVNDSVSWSGSIFSGLDTVKEMSRNLPSRYKAGYASLSQVIQDYEGLPETATLQADKDPVPSGEKMTVHLTDIKDYQGRLSQPWQWVVVKAENGQILNGREQSDGTHAFQVGDSGAIDLKYQAPDECEEGDTDTLMVYNSCIDSLKASSWISPEKQIATTTFDIECLSGWLLEFTCTESGNDDYDSRNEPGYNPPDNFVTGSFERRYTLKGRAMLLPSQIAASDSEWFHLLGFSLDQEFACDTVYLQIQENGHIVVYEDWSSRGDGEYDYLYEYQEDTWSAQYDGDLAIPIRLWVFAYPANQGYPAGLHYWIDGCVYQEGNEGNAIPTIPYQYTHKCHHWEWDPPSDGNRSGTCESSAFWSVCEAFDNLIQGNPGYWYDQEILTGDRTYGLGGACHCPLLDPGDLNPRDSAVGCGCLDGFDPVGECEVTWTLTKIGGDSGS